MPYYKAMETCSILLSLSYRPPGTHACLHTNFILKIIELVSDACPPIPHCPIGKKWGSEPSP